MAEPIIKMSLRKPRGKGGAWQEVIEIFFRGRSAERMVFSYGSLEEYQANVASHVESATLLAQQIKRRYQSPDATT